MRTKPTGLKLRKLGNDAFSVETPPEHIKLHAIVFCLLYTSPSPRDATLSRMPSSA